MKTLDKILYLIPNARCSVWGCPLEDYQGENSPITLDGNLVDWKDIRPCPSQADLDSIDLVKAKDSLKSDPSSSLYEVQDTKADLLAQLAELTAKINALQS